MGDSFFVFVVDSSHHHVTVSVRIIAARCCAIVGRGFFAPLSSLQIFYLQFPPSMSDFFYFSFLSSWRFLICYSAAVPLARFHFCFIFGWFCRVVLRHTKSPRSRSDVTHTQGKRYPLDESDIYDAFIMKYFGFCLFFYFKQNVVPRFFYTKIFKSNGIEITSPHTCCIGLKSGPSSFSAFPYCTDFLIIFGRERENDLGVFIRKGLKGERRRKIQTSPSPLCIIIHHRLGNCV
jgi:hypothetical protein